MRRSIAVALAALSIGCTVPVLAQAQQADPAALIAAQKAALAPLSRMDGVWRGSAWSILPGGVKHEVTQTERIGPFLDGSVKMFEGRGYNADGTVGFNALGVMAYNPTTGAWTLTSWAQGRAGVFPMTLTDDGYVWTVPAGPKATIRYTAVITAGAWREIGEYVIDGQPPRQIFEMNLKRVGDSSWPGAGAVSRE